ncbi:hypothetical protein, partial [Mesorhizobium sp. M7A.F.Ca.MR.362.00.0.0]|uniref:hypothetical protein n=1 Tax=Mesorhizobium sp. M7A.F.Ca.MR.362.00.0.0 TaxID=2496779 RepID=UPI0019D429A5
MNQVHIDFSDIDYLFGPGCIIDDRYLYPEFEGLIVALNSYLTNKSNRGINSLGKLQGIVANFEFSFNKDTKFTFDRNDVVQI